jgi:GNAT superfamily N-acetyltransferase
VADFSRPQSNWKVRPFQHGDAPRARRLIEAVWHEHFDRHPDPFVRDFIYSRLSDIDNADTVYGDRAIFLCAVAEAEIIGTGAIKRLDNRECEMARMFVASTCRGRGIGRAIADELIKFALSAGYDQVRLSSNNVLAASHQKASASPRCCLPSVIDVLPICYLWDQEGDSGVMVGRRITVKARLGCPRKQECQIRNGLQRPRRSAAN